MIPLLTSRRTSCGQASGPSSCTVSGVRFCSSIPVGISLFLDTQTPQTSSSVWRSPQCLGPGSGTLLWSTGTGGWRENSDSYRKPLYFFFFKVLLLWSVMCIKVFDDFRNISQDAAKCLTLFAKVGGKKKRQKTERGVYLIICLCCVNMIPFITGRGVGEDWICFRGRPSRGSVWRPSWKTPYLIGGEQQCHAVQPPAGTLPDDVSCELGPLSHNRRGMHWFRIIMVWLAYGKIPASAL